MNYRRTGGKLVVLAGLASGMIAIGSAVLLAFDISIGASIGMGLILAMMAVFGSRYMRTRTFIPEGAMLILSLVAIGALARAMK